MSAALLYRVAHLGNLLRTPISIGSKIKFIDTMGIGWLGWFSGLWLWGGTNLYIGTLLPLFEKFPLLSQNQALSICFFHLKASLRQTGLGIILALTILCFSDSMVVISDLNWDARMENNWREDRAYSVPFLKTLHVFSLFSN